jgi:hypothetical protein
VFCVHLTVLSIFPCRLQGTPSLAVVKLEGCEGLLEVDLSSCPRLRHVYIKGCPQLEGVELGGCTALQQLEIRRHENLRRVGLKGAAALQKLDIAFCYELLEVDGLDELGALTGLEVCHCDKLPELCLGATSMLQGLGAATSNTTRKVSGLDGDGPTTQQVKAMPGSGPVPSDCTARLCFQPASNESDLCSRCSVPYLRLM